MLPKEESNLCLNLQCHLSYTTRRLGSLFSFYRETDKHWYWRRDSNSHFSDWKSGHLSQLVDSSIYFKQLFINQISCQTLNLTKYFLILSGRLDSNQHLPRPDEAASSQLAYFPLYYIPFNFSFCWLLISSVRTVLLLPICHLLHLLHL